METKINITTILKDKPKGTKLYSTVHGKCTFEAITDEIFKIHFCTSKFGLTQTGECVLIKFGNMFDGGECIVFPSEEMRDWSRFAWKRVIYLQVMMERQWLSLINGTMIPIQVSIVGIILTVKIKIIQYITVNFYVRQKSILLKIISMPIMITSRQLRKN